MQPIVDRLEVDYGSQVKFLQLDANSEGKDAFKAGHFPGHPSYVILQPNGDETWRKFGVLSFEDMASAIRDALDQS